MRGAWEKAKQSRAEQVVVVKLSSLLRRNFLKNSERRNGKRFQDHICEFFAANNASWYVLVLDLALTSVNNAWWSRLFVKWAEFLYLLWFFLFGFHCHRHWLVLYSDSDNGVVIEKGIIHCTVILFYTVYRFFSSSMWANYYVFSRFFLCVKHYYLCNMYL